MSVIITATVGAFKSERTLVSLKIGYAREAKRAQGNPVFQYEATINEQVVIVRVVTLFNGVIQVTDSWVKTK